MCGRRRRRGEANLAPVLMAIDLPVRAVDMATSADCRLAAASLSGTAANLRHERVFIYCAERIARLPQSFQAPL